MKKENESRNIIISMIVTVILLVWLIMTVGCAGVNLDEEGHWPGWIVEPYYGPHDLSQTEQIRLRNAYSDGWQDRGEAIKYER